MADVTGPTPVENMTLDAARDEFHEKRDWRSAAIYRAVARSYADDGMIADGTLNAIITETAPFLDEK